jgi:hypothetical protein
MVSNLSGVRDFILLDAQVQAQLLYLQIKKRRGGQAASAAAL